MDSSVKSLTITGSAAEDAVRSRQKAAGSRRKRGVIKEDNEFIEEVKKFTEHNALPTNVKPPVKVIVPAQPVLIPPPVQPVKPLITTNVILNPPKQARVKLQPKVPHVQKPVEHATRKARRIHLSVGNLSHRVTRARRLTADTEKKPMSTIRDYLIQKGVIQGKSKAPEKMLRSMYSDFMLLKDQAL